MPCSEADVFVVVVCLSFSPLPDFSGQPEAPLLSRSSSLTCCEKRLWCAGSWVTAWNVADERRRYPDIYLAADGNSSLHEWIGRRRSCRFGKLTHKWRSHLLLLSPYTLHASFVFLPHSHTRLFLSAALLPCLSHRLFILRSVLPAVCEWPGRIQIVWGWLFSLLCL